VNFHRSHVMRKMQADSLASLASNVAKGVSAAAISLISVVSVDESVHESLQGLIRSAGFEVRISWRADGSGIPVTFNTAHGDDGAAGAQALRDALWITCSNR